MSMPILQGQHLPALPYNLTYLTLLNMITGLLIIYFMIFQLHIIYYIMLF